MVTTRSKIYGSTSPEFQNFNQHFFRRLLCSFSTAMSSAVVAEAPSKTKATKAPKTKKSTSAPKKPKAYPTYHEMVKEAIVALKERTGSSQIAITKFIEEKQKGNLPANFKKLLLVQLRKLVANGKLVKVKNSFKLPPKSPSAAAPPAKKSASSKPKAESKAKAVPAKRKAATEAKPKKAAKTATAKKAVAAKKVKSIKSPAKKVKSIKSPAKKPKSIKSPAKKAAAKKAKK